MDFLEVIFWSTGSELYIHMFPEEHKKFLPVIENILCDLYGIDYDNDKERIYTEKKNHKDGEIQFNFDSNKNIVESTIPPKGSIVFFCHFVAMRIDNMRIENILKQME